MPSSGPTAPRPTRSPSSAGPARAARPSGTTPARRCRCGSSWHRARPGRSSSASASATLTSHGATSVRAYALTLVAPWLVRVADAEAEDDLPGLARCQLEPHLQRRAGVVPDGLAARAGPALDGERVGLGAVGPEEGIPVGVEPDDVGPGHPEPQLAHRIPGRVAPVDHPVGAGRPDHVLAVLQVLQVLAVAPLVGELGVGEDRD